MQCAPPGGRGPAAALVGVTGRRASVALVSADADSERAAVADVAGAAAAAVVLLGTAVDDAAASAPVGVAQGFCSHLTASEPRSLAGCVPRIWNNQSRTSVTVSYTHLTLPTNREV